jgi:hypothetical protein
MFFIVIIGFFT